MIILSLVPKMVDQMSFFVFGGINRIVVYYELLNQNATNTGDRYRL